MTAVLTARNRLRRSSDFDAAVKHGTRAVQPHVVMYVHREVDPAVDAPKVGLIVSRSIGSAVQRHRMSRRLRHAAREVLPDLDGSQRLVIRALPSGRHVGTERLVEELRTGLRRAAKTGNPK